MCAPPPLVSLGVYARVARSREQLAIGTIKCEICTRKLPAAAVPLLRPVGGGGFHPNTPLRRGGLTLAGGAAGINIGGGGGARAREVLLPPPLGWLGVGGGLDP